MLTEKSSAETAAPIKYGSPTKADFLRLKQKGFIEGPAVHKYIPGNFAATSAYTPAYHDYLRSLGLTCWECVYTNAGGRRRVYDLYEVRRCSKDLKIEQKMAKLAKRIVVDPQQQFDLTTAMTQETNKPSEVVASVTKDVYLTQRISELEDSLKALAAQARYEATKSEESHAMLIHLVDMFKPVDVTAADDGSQIGEIAK
jgi:hypothetical protein